MTDEGAGKRRYEPLGLSASEACCWLTAAREPAVSSVALSSRPARATERDRTDENHHLAKVRVASSNPSSVPKRCPVQHREQRIIPCDRCPQLYYGGVRSTRGRLPRGKSLSVTNTSGLPQVSTALGRTSTMS